MNDFIPSCVDHIFIRNEEDMSSRKSILFGLCREAIRNKVGRLQALIQEAQQSANEETKSSAGDKYETGRAMVQLEIEKYAEQLNELQKQSLELEKVSAAPPQNNIGPAALVETSNGTFLIAVNAGEFALEGKKVYAISAQAPIAQKMIGLRQGDSFTMNGRAYSIMSVE